MKVLAVNSARSIWLVSTIFLNPQGRNIVPAMAALAERYGFAKVPQAKDLTVRPLNLKFEGGSFVGSDGSPIFVSLSVHDDGFIAETRASTDESDRFLDEVLSWFSVEYDLPLYSDIGVEKIYASELIVQLDLPRSIFSEQFSKYVDRLHHGISNNPGKPMELVALHFGPDPETTKKVAPYRIERLAATPFNKNQYYSVAPVPTAEHLELLEALERAASA